MNKNGLRLQDAIIPKIIIGTVWGVFTNQNKNICIKLIVKYLINVIADNKIYFRGGFYVKN